MPWDNNAGGGGRNNSGGPWGQAPQGGGGPRRGGTPNLEDILNRGRDRLQGGMPGMPGGRWAARADLGYHAFQLRYPDAYIEPALDSTSVLPASHSKSNWLNNKAVTFGVSYQLFR